MIAALTVEQLLGINPELDPKKLRDGQTILLPSEKLSSRDKEILDGIGAGYRVYPVREGETVSDIITKRKITMEEMQSLNPGVDFMALKGAFHIDTHRCVCACASCTLAAPCAQLRKHEVHHRFRGCSQPTTSPLHGHICTHPPLFWGRSTIN